MPYQTSANTAHAGDPSTVLHTLSNTTPAAARRFATRHPDVRFFMYCREDVELSAGAFKKGDAVFFSGTPAPTRAPAADLIVKSYMMTGYSVTDRPGTLSDLGCYQLSDGTPLFDIAILYAGSIIGEADAPQITLSSYVTSILDTSAVSDLQNQGIVVLLSFAGSYQAAGWSCCPTSQVAASLAQQMMSIVTQYDLDGIDIDDEYSTGQTYDDSLIQVVYAFRSLNPYYLVTKALFEDLQYFQASWNGISLASILSYGWEMSYGDSDCGGVLSPYVNAGMSSWQLSGGVNANQSGSPAPLSNCIVSNGYGGMMVWLVGDATTDYLSKISNALYESSTTTPDGCLS